MPDEDVVDRGKSSLNLGDRPDGLHRHSSARIGFGTLNSSAGSVPGELGDEYARGGPVERCRDQRDICDDEHRQTPDEHSPTGESVRRRLCRPDPSDRGAAQTASCSPAESRRDEAPLRPPRTLDAAVPVPSLRNIEGMLSAHFPSAARRLVRGGSRRLRDHRSAAARRRRVTRGELHWRIKISSPEGPTGDRWGDTAFADDLAAALRDLGQVVAVDRLGAADRPGRDVDDVTLVLRGLHKIAPVEGSLNYLWVISHPDEVEDSELRDGWRRVFAASTSWARAREHGVEPLLQATSTSRFSVERSDGDIEEDVLFVGTSRGVVRPVVRDAIDAGARLAVYGHDWERFISPDYVRADHLDFASVPGAYRASRLVLNDHWADMRANGFLSNRLFDATAVGALVISDDVEGIDEIFGGLVRTYRDQDELRRLLFDAEGWPEPAERREVAQRIRTDHSFAARARALLASALKDLRQR